MRRPPIIVPLSDVRIAEQQQSVIFGNLAMMAADQGMGHGDVRIAAASHDGGQFQRYLAFDRLAEDNKEFGIHGPFCPRFTKKTRRSINSLPLVPS